jgi:hypothetical protein
MSSVTPSSTTAALAGQVPKEGSKEVSSGLPGTFPETPATEPSDFSVNPIPKTDGPGNPIKLAPGEKVPDASTLTGNTISSTVGRDEPETFSVNPIPASSGAGNPIHLAPGEKVPDPSTISGNTVNNTVSLDKESYERGETGASAFSSGTSNSVGDSALGGGMFGVPPVTKNMIPESSLPMGSGAVGETDPGVTIQSAGPQSTTAALAGQVPLEPRVPAVVKESQKEAHVDPEASASSEAVKEKSEVEQELKKVVPEEPAATESGFSAGKIAGAVTGGAAAAGAAIAGTAYLAKDKAVDATKSIDPSTAHTSVVPDVVKDSIAKAHISPEASANPEAVKEKDAMEAELEKKVKVSNATGEPAPTPGPAGGLSETALSSPEPLTSSSEPKLNAPATAAATTPAQKDLATPSTPTKPTISRDVSPKGGPAVPSSSADVPPTTPAKTTTDIPASTKATEADSVAGTPDTKAEKKKKRHSILHKLKKLLK